MFNIKIVYIFVNQMDQKCLSDHAYFNNSGIYNCFQYISENMRRTFKDLEFKHKHEY